MSDPELPEDDEREPKRYHVVVERVQSIVFEFEADEGDNLEEMALEEADNVSSNEWHTESMTVESGPTPV